MKALVIGGGSIGSRHREILGSLTNANGTPVFARVDTVSRHARETMQSGEPQHGKYFRVLEELSDESGETNLSNYDYFIIASETTRHLEQFLYLSERVTAKRILIEKPVFDSESDSKQRIAELSETLHDAARKNQVCVAYNLRFHPIIKKLYELLSFESKGNEYPSGRLLSFSVYVGQYLPDWRPTRDYRVTYSAKKSEGGGVLLDLSHEIDYLQLVCGKISQATGFVGRVSDLEIDTEDLALFSGITERGVAFQVGLDYLSRHPVRKILAHASLCTFEADLIAQKLWRSDANGRVEIECNESIPIARNFTYTAMHSAMLGLSQNSGVPLCGFSEGLAVLDAIDMIRRGAIQA